MSITINPVLQTNAAGSFSSSSVGYVQGVALDDPAVRNQLAGGYLKVGEALPMWGGVAISEDIPVQTNDAANSLGSPIMRATALTGAKLLTGFSVFNQAHAMINTPQSPVPQAGVGMHLNFYRLGSLARIGVSAAPSLVSLAGGLVTQQVSWDFTAQQLIPFSGSYVQGNITGAVWSNTAGGQVSFTVDTDYTANINAGDVIETSGVVSTAAAGVYNGQFTVVSVDATHIVVVYLAAASPGTYSSGGIVLAGGGALPVQVRDIQAGNSMTVTYDPVTGFTTWNRSGTVAIITI